MKMHSGLFWGLLLIIIGVSLIIKVVLRIDFPIMKVLLAFFFFYMGFKILFGNFGNCSVKSKHQNVFSEARYKDIIQPEKEYQVVFGKGYFDFRNVQLPDSGYVEVKVSSVFGGSEIILASKTPVRIKADAAFSGTQLPNGNTAAFGTANYESENFDESKPYLYLKIEVVFGAIDIRRY